ERGSSFRPAAAPAAPRPRGGGAGRVVRPFPVAGDDGRAARSAGLRAPPLRPRACDRRRDGPRRTTARVGAGCVGGRPGSPLRRRGRRLAGRRGPPTRRRWRTRPCGRRRHAGRRQRPARRAAPHPPRAQARRAVPRRVCRRGQPAPAARCLGRSRGAGRRRGRAAAAPPDRRAQRGRSPSARRLRFAGGGHGANRSPLPQPVSLGRGPARDGREQHPRPPRQAPAPPRGDRARGGGVRRERRAGALRADLPVRLGALARPAQARRARLRHPLARRRAPPPRL
ncbi:MAG: SAM-dependent methyltransferase, BioC-like, partial [uncultured Sphingomonadaceae bacterium]